MAPTSARSRSSGSSAQLGGDRAAADGPRGPAVRAGRQPLARRRRLAARTGASATDWYLRRDGGSRRSRPAPTRVIRHVRLRPARPVPDLRRRSREAARLRARPDGPGADPRPARRARLHVGRPRARRRGDRPVTARLFDEPRAASRTDFVVKLCDVHHDGRTFNVCDGIVRTTDERHRRVDRRHVGDGDRVPAPVTASACSSRRATSRATSATPTPARTPGRPPCSSPSLQRVFHDAQRARPPSCCPVIDTVSVDAPPRRAERVRDQHHAVRPRTAQIDWDGTRAHLQRLAESGIGVYVGGGGSGEGHALLRTRSTACSRSRPRSSSGRCRRARWAWSPAPRAR